MGVAALLVSLVAALAVAASAGSDERIVVTRDSHSLPSGCTPAETAQLLVRLAGAVTAGDRKSLARLFAIEDPPGRPRVEQARPFFRWYSVGDQVGLYDRAQLFPYFAARHRRNERWQLITVDVGRTWIPGSAAVGYAFRRSASDLPSWASELAYGKGEIDCVAQRIYVWSMAQGDRRESARPTLTPCPLPSAWSPGDPVVTCSRSALPDVGTGRTARSVLPDVRLLGARAPLPRRCEARTAFRRLRAALSAFDTGDGPTFARLFTAGGSLHAYTRSGRPLRGRTGISAFVASRHERRDGWTASSVRAPSRARGRVARYRTDLLLSSPGEELMASTATIDLDCRSGGIARWVGPRTAAPGSTSR